MWNIELEKKNLLRLISNLLFAVEWILLFFMLAFPGPVDALEQYNIKIMTVQKGRSIYVQDMALEDVINKNSTWLQACTIEGRGSAYNLKRVVSDPLLRKTALINLPQTVHWEAQKQFPIFSGIRFDFSKIRYLFLSGVYFDAMISLDPKIKNFYDLIDKRVAVGPLPTNDSTLTMFYDALGCRCVVRKFMLFNNSHQALRNGRLDSIMTGGHLKGLPNHWVMSPFAQEIVDTQDTFFISWDKHVLEQKSKENSIPYYPAVIPAGTFRKQNQPWVIAAKYLTYAVFPEMPDSVVAEVIRVVHENFRTSYESIEGINISSRKTMGMMGPSLQYYHPVALKYYQQHGIQIGELIR